jgi:hypothetical protein
VARRNDLFWAALAIAVLAVALGVTLGLLIHAMR